MNVTSSDLSPDVKFRQALKLFQGNHYSDALRVLDDILRTHPQYFAAWNLTGIIQRHQGNLQDAINSFMRALSIKPGYSDARENLQEVNSHLGAIREWRPGTGDIHAYWFNRVPNWGDIINEYLLEKLSGKRVQWMAPFDYRAKVKYIATGSILAGADTNTIVWGTGAMSEDRCLKVRPREICAVRGPLTRQLILQQGLACPEIFGDPALLFPRYYNPDIEVTHELGIIPHFVDQGNPWLLKARDLGVRVIDILGGLEHVVNEVKSCSRIASSTLHGLIVADSYGIPSTWIELSDGVVGRGFKFRDYFSSVNRPLSRPLRIGPQTGTSELLDSFQDYVIDIDLDILLASCPFKNI